MKKYFVLYVLLLFLIGSCCESNKSTKKNPVVIRYNIQRVFHLHNNRGDSYFHVYTKDETTKELTLVKFYGNYKLFEDVEDDQPLWAESIQNAGEYATLHIHIRKSTRLD